MLEVMPKVDSNGRSLAVGDEVRVVGKPDLSGLSEEGQSEAGAVFEHILGTYRRIVDFDEYGHAEIVLTIRAGPAKGYHTVWIEPYLLRLRGSGGEGEKG